MKQQALIKSGFAGKDFLEWIHVYTAKKMRHSTVRLTCIVESVFGEPKKLTSSWNVEKTIPSLTWQSIGILCSIPLVFLEVAKKSLGPNLD